MDFKTDILDGVTRSIDAKDLKDFLFLQGKYHAQDRFVQMEMLRIVSQGRICELLDDTEANLAIDKHMRELGIYHYSVIEEEQLSEHGKKLLTSYCDGVNSRISQSIPLEFTIMGHRPEKWKIADCIVSIKAMAYLGLAQGQQDLQKLFIQMVKNGVPSDKINSLSQNQMGDLTEEIIHLIKKVNLYNPLIPESYNFLKNIPKVQASNNWLFKNGSGEVLHASDPHLEVNRLPAVWYEMKATVANSKLFGISMPGVPGIVMGRKDGLSFSFTYGFMDMIDFFIEEVKDNKFRDGSEFINFDVRREVIKRKKKNDVKVIIRKTQSGVLDAPSDSPLLTDGIYLSTAWSCRSNGSAKTLESILGIFESNSVDQLVEHTSNVSISCNWLIADDNGSMAYQQSGLLPKRKSTGLVPLIGWIEENRWSGIYEGHELLSFKENERNSIVTANNLIERDGFPKAINAPMGDYRHDRVVELLKEKKNHTIEDFKRIQSDLVSLQSKKFLNKYKDNFKDSKYSTLLDWDYSYSTNSKKAVVFEEFYRVLTKKFFSEHLMNKEEILFCLDQTSFIADFYGLFDRLFLEEISEEESKLWFSNRKKEEYIDLALDKMTSSGRLWGEINKIDMNYILLDGKLPAFMGLDKRDVQIPGNRATIVQGQVFNAHGRKSSFCPSWKLITDMSTGDLYTVLPGGLNDRPLSKLFKSDLNNWISFGYRKNSL